MLGLALRTLALVVLGALVGYAQNYVRADGVSLAGFEAPTSCGAGVRVTAAVGVVGADEAVQLVESSAASTTPGARLLVLDGRSAEAFEQGHVAGAEHLPCAAGIAAAEHVTALAGSATRVLVYAGDDADAHSVAEELARRVGPGVTLDVVRGGFDALSAAGVPAASGPCAECREDGPR